MKLSFIGRETGNIRFWGWMGLAKDASKPISFNVELGKEIEIVEISAGVLMSKYMNKPDVKIGLADRLDDFFNEVIVRIHGDIGEGSDVSQSLGDFGNEALVIGRNFQTPLVVGEAEKFEESKKFDD
jgi:hypothetical protein